MLNPFTSTDRRFDITRPAPAPKPTNTTKDN